MQNQIAILLHVDRESRQTLWLQLWKFHTNTIVNCINLQKIFVSTITCDFQFLSATQV